MPQTVDGLLRTVASDHADAPALVYGERSLSYRALMGEIESEARRLKRSLITLDTRTGDNAEPLYRSLGYQTTGIIPGYCRDTLSERLDPTTIMYKHL